MASTLNASSSGAGGLVSTADASGILQLQTAGTTAVTVDASGLVQIGTTTAAASNAMLTVYNPNATSAQIYLQNTTTGTGSANGSRVLATGNDLYITNKEAGFMAFETSDTERMRLDSAGNLGLGVTPSAWAVFKALQIGPQGAVMATSNSMQMGTNIYFDGAYKFIGTGYANRYYQTGGAHYWTVSTASGSAGGAVTETQAMTLDASGNLAVGATSAGGFRLKVSGTGGTLAGNAKYVGVFDDATGSAKGVGFGYDTSGQTGIVYAETGSAASNLAFWTYTGSAWGERARIDSSGNFLVGTTSGSSNTFLKGVTDIPSLIVRNNLSSGNLFGINANFNNFAPNNTTSFFLQCNDSGAERATIRSNGGLANYQGNNANLSDRREKTNFAPATSYLDKICAIPVQTFNYIDQNLEEDGGLTLGVVAQDVQAIAPELVMESDWSIEKDGSKMRLSIYQTDLQYALMKALQELKADFDAYKASHP